MARIWIKKYGYFQCNRKKKCPVQTFVNYINIILTREELMNKLLWINIQNCIFYFSHKFIILLNELNNGDCGLIIIFSVINENYLVIKKTVLIKV